MSEVLVSSLESKNLSNKYSPDWPKTYLYDEVSRKVEASNEKNLFSIETRLGNYLKARSLTPEILGSSFEAPFILQTNKKRKHDEVAKYLSQFAGNFTPGFSESRFSFVAETCEKLSEEVYSATIVDFTFFDAKIGRLRWDVGKNFFEENTKTKKRYRLG